MKKRLLAIVLALILVAVAFVGCTKNVSQQSADNGTKTKKNETKNDDEPKVDELEEVTLRFYFPSDPKEKAGEVYDAISETYKQQLNAKFDVTWIPWTEYKNKIIAMTASGDDYDMNFDGDWLAFSQMATKGAYLDVADLLPEYAPDLYAKYQELNVLSAATVDGQVVGLPWTMSMSQRPYFGWNSNLAEEAGVSFGNGDVKTFEDIDKLLSELYAYYGEGSGKQITGLVNNDSVYVKHGLVPLNFHNLVYSIDDPECKIMAFEQTEAYYDKAFWAKKWNDAGYIPKDAVLEIVDGNTLLSEEICLTHFTWHEWKDKLGKLDGVAAYSELYPENKYANRTPLANIVAINANAANPERTLMFLNLVETDKVMYDLLHYGIKDVTYKLDGEMAVYPEEGMNVTNSSYMEWGGQWALWKPQFMRPNDTYGPGFWEKEAELAALDKNVNAPLNGFLPNSDNIKNELAARDQIWEFDKQIGYGAFDMTVDEAVQKMIDEQKAAGIDAIIADVQAQVDAYLGK